MFRYHVFSRKQTAVFHGSTDAEITSLNAGLRLDGLPALQHFIEFIDTVIDVLEPSAGGNTMPLHPKHQQQQDTALATFEQIDFAPRATILHETLLFFSTKLQSKFSKKGIDHQ